MADIGMRRKRSRVEETRKVVEALRDLRMSNRFIDLDDGGVRIEVWCPVCLSKSPLEKMLAHEPDCAILLAMDLLATPENRDFLMGCSYYVEDEE